MTKNRKQTLSQALTLIRTGRGLNDVTRCGLAGCPVGGWPETSQAIRRMENALPVPAARHYTVSDLIGALYTIDSAERYQYQD